MTRTIGTTRVRQLLTRTSLMLLALALVGAPARAGTVAVSVPTWTSNYEWSAGDGYSGWSRSDFTLDPLGYSTALGLPGQPGYWLWLAGDREYRPGGVDIVLTAPGTTRIASAQLNLAYRDKLFAHHCLEIGLRNGSSRRAATRTCSPPVAPAAESSYDVSLNDPSDRPEAKQIYMRVEMPVCKNPSDNACSKYIPSHDPLLNAPMTRMKQVDLVLVDDDLPTVTASGELSDLADHYIDGSGTYHVSLNAADGGAGVASTDVELVNERNFGHATAPCDPAHHTDAYGSAICPASFQPDAFALDTAELSEGRHVVLASATDLAGNRGVGAPWQFFIDRSAPTQPANTEFITEDRSAEADWDDATDPVLADGSPGSGVAGYRSRHRIEGGPWTDWQTLAADDSQAGPIEDLPAGTNVEFEVESFDAVGNRSEPVAVSGVVEDDTPEETDSTGVIKHSDEVVSQQGEMTATGCSFPDPASLVLGPGQFGAYEDEVDVSLDNCVRTLDRGTLELGDSPEDRAAFERDLGPTLSAIDPPAKATAAGSPSASASSTTARASAALDAHDIKAVYLQKVRAGIDLGGGVSAGYLQWRSGTGTRWVYGWNGPGNGVGYFPPDKFPEAWSWEVNPRRYLGWSLRYQPINGADWGHTAYVKHTLSAGGKAKLAPLYKVVVKKLLRGKAPDFVISIVNKLIEKGASCQIRIDEPHHDMTGDQFGIFKADGKDPKISFHGGLLGACKVVDVINDRSPIKFFSKRRLYRVFDRFYRF